MVQSRRKQQNKKKKNAHTSIDVVAFDFTQYIDTSTLARFETQDICALWLCVCVLKNILGESRKFYLTDTHTCDGIKINKSTTTTTTTSSI